MAHTTLSAQIATVGVLIKHRSQRKLNSALRALEVKQCKCLALLNPPATTQEKKGKTNILDKVSMSFFVPPFIKSEGYKEPQTKHEHALHVQVSEHMAYQGLESIF